MSVQQVQKLLDWAKSNGAEINEKLSFKDSKDHGISCIINESLTADERSSLIKIPHDLIISPELADKFADQYINTTTSNANINVNLIFLLSKLKFDTFSPVIIDNENINEKFAPYIDYLPKDGKSTGNPYFWTLEEKELLDGTDAFIFMKRNFLKSLEDWKKIVSQLDVSVYPQLKDELLEYEAFKMGPTGGVAVNYLLNIKEISWTSFTAYLWSSCIIQSRAFPYILFSKSNLKYKNNAFLLPVVDLLNNEDENKSKCKWTVDENNNFVFNTLDDLTKLTKDNELFNNYGDKTNVEFLLNYGFCLKGNTNESTTLTLKLDPSVIEGARKYGVIIPVDSTDECINFELKRNQDLSKNLINFFAYLVKLGSEKKGFTLRMKLEGLTQLKAIIKTKLKTLRKVEVVKSDVVSDVTAKTIKAYRKSQKDIFQQCLEQIEKLEKQYLNDFKPFSFKKALTKDTRFFNSFLLVFGTRTYNDLVEKNLVDHAVLLWIMRISNRDAYTDIIDKSIWPAFIFNEFQKVKNSTQIDNDDIAEYLPMYQSLFPALCQKIPAIFDRGNWTLNHLIYAATVADRLTYKRETNGEVFFIDPAQSR